MTYKVFTVLIGLAFYTPSLGQTNVWTQMDSVKGPPKSACVGFANYSFGYIGLGFDQFDYKRSLFVYNPGFNLWDKVESMGGEFSTGLNRSSAVAFVIDNKAYVGTGQGDNPYFGDFWMYDMSTNTWTQVANFGGGPRTEAVAFASNNMGYVGTGKSAAGLTNDFWKFDPSMNSWTQVSPIPGNPRKQAVAVSLGINNFVGTGDDGTFTDDFYKYDASTDTWTQVSDFAGTPRYGAVAFGIYPNLFVGTGYDNTLSYTKDFWSYNSLNDTWTQVQDFPGTARSRAAGFSINGTGYVGTGYDGQPTDDFYAYTPQLGKQEINSSHSIVYPNPAINQIQIDSDYSETMQIEIMDVSGKLVLSEHHSANKPIDISALVPGTYAYRLLDNNNLITFGKFLKQND